MDYCEEEYEFNNNYFKDILCSDYIGFVRSLLELDLSKTDKDKTKKLVKVFDEFCIKLDHNRYIVYVFYEFLRTFKTVPKATTNAIMKSIMSLMAFNLPFEITKDEGGESKIRFCINDMDIFHPFNLDVSLKTTIQYLKATNTLQMLNGVSRDVIYTKIANETTSDGGSIYQSLNKYERDFNNYKIDTFISAQDFKNLFKPPLTFNDYKKNLIRHSTNYYFASQYNKSVESDIFKILKTKKEATFNHSKSTTEINDIIKQHETQQGWELTEEQRNCIRTCVDNPISVINGSAGTGKTTIATGIARVLRKMGQTVVFVTISAKATGVIADKVARAFPPILEPTMIDGIETMTIASYMIKSRYDKASTDNIIIDEASMIGNSYCLAFLKLFKERLIMIGDNKQVLPVKQVGTPFISITKHSEFQEYINITELTIVQRQASDNPLSKFIQHTIDQQELNVPSYKNQKKGVFYLTLDEDDYDDKFSEFYIKFKKTNNKVNDFACVKPARYADTSTLVQVKIFEGKKELAINTGYDVTKFPNVFKGSIVMRCCNSRTKYVVDGSGNTIQSQVMEDPNETDDLKEIAISCNGKVREISTPNGSFGEVIGKVGNGFGELITVRYYNVLYTWGNLKGAMFEESITKQNFFNQFQLGYCQSTHKYQGSEFPNVLFNLHKSIIPSIGTKNIFYTSITRAQELLIICGTEKDKRVYLDMMTSEFANPIQDIIGLENITTDVKLKICGQFMLETRMLPEEDFLDKIDETIKSFIQKIFQVKRISEMNR